MTDNLEIEFFHGADPFPDEWIAPIAEGEAALLQQTLTWLSEQSFGALAFPFTPKAETKTQWLESRKKNKLNYLVAALREGKKLTVVGFIDITFRLTRLHSYTTEVLPQGFPAVAYINALYTLPEFRGRGIATALMAEAEAVARRAKCKMMTLTYNTRNTAASKFYYRKKYSHLETQFYGLIRKPKNTANVFVQKLPFVELKRHRGVFFELKNYVTNDSKGFYPLYSEIDTAAKALQSNSAATGLQINGGRDGYALIKPILRDSIVSVYPMLFASRIWTDSTKLRKYLYAIGQICKTAYGTEVLHTCTMDQGKVRFLEGAGFVQMSEVLRKQL